MRNYSIFPVIHNVCTSIWSNWRHTKSKLVDTFTSYADTLSIKSKSNNRFVYIFALCTTWNEHKKFHLKTNQWILSWFNSFFFSLSSTLLFLFQGHDNFGHSIPELLEGNTPIRSVDNSTHSSTSTALHPNYFTSQQEIMSPLPMHNRPLMGRRLGLSVDAFIWIFCKLNSCVLKEIRKLSLKK